MLALGAILFWATFATTVTQSVDWGGKVDIIDATCGLRPVAEPKAKPSLIYMQFEAALEKDAGKDGGATISPSNFRILDRSEKLPVASFDRMESDAKGLRFWTKPKVTGNIPMAMIMVPNGNEKPGSGKFGVIVVSEGTTSSKGKLLYDGNCALSFHPIGAQSVWDDTLKDPRFN